MTDGSRAPAGQQPDDEPDPTGRRGRKRRRQRVTRESLERWAIRHLDRFGSSSVNLKWVLIRRVRRIEQAQQEFFPDAPAWIDDAVAALLARGYLDDRKYAISLVERMRARGASGRRIERSLTEKGIPRALAGEVVAGDGDGDELRAAVRYARRRKLGPFRLDPELRAEKRERDLAALGRSGFSYEIARRIVEAEDADSLASCAIDRL